MQRHADAACKMPLSPLEQPETALPWLWIGTWSMGGAGFGPSNHRTALAVLQRAYRVGVRHFDTAGFYARGRSEELLCKAFHTNRKSVFLSTKGGLVWEGKTVRHRGSPKDLRIALLASLERLQTDYLDLYQLHWPDPAVPLMESIAALKDLQKEGLTRYWGVGNLTADEIRTEIEEQAGIPHQVHHNPICKNDLVLTAGKAQGRCFNCITSPFEQGLLAGGRSAEGLRFLGKKDVRQRNPLFRSQTTAAWLGRFRELADASPIPRVSLVLLWILAGGSTDAIIPGPRTLAQLDQVLAHRTWLEFLGGRNTGCPHDLADNLRDALGHDLWSFLASHP